MFKSAYEKCEEIVYFPRMLDKIRMQARGELPEAYVPYLGMGFDGRCVAFLGVAYESLKAVVLEGKSDQEVMDWCKANGASRSDDEKLIWNEFMTKRGWRDSAPSTDDFQKYKDQYGMGDRDDIKTYFDFFEVDEGRAE